MKTFTNCAEKKAKQFLNLLQGYTKGIRFTAILILLLIGVSNAWAAYYYRGNQNGWGATQMTASADGFYEYFAAKSHANNGNQNQMFKVSTSSSSWNYNNTYMSSGFNGTNITNMGNWDSDNICMYHDKDYYILVYKPNTTINTSSNPKICAATYLPDNRECTVYFVNKDSWNSVNAYGWYYQNSTDGPNNGWPGKAMTNTGKTYNGKQIWSYTYPQTYDKAIFNNGSSKTSDLTLGTTNKGKMYDYPNSQWIAYTYDVKVTFNANGHGTAPTAKTVLKGGKVTAPTAPTATGYTFGGWYKEANCTNAFDFNTAITADITLYAKWTEKTYSLTFKHDGHGTIKVGGTTVNSGSTASVNHVNTKTLVATPNTGYNFSSWTLSGSDTSAVTIGSTSTASTTIKATNTGATVTANFTPKTYTITLDKNGGASNGSATATYNSNSVTNATYPTRTDYRCNGYFTAATDGTLVLNTDGTLAKSVSGYTDANGNWTKDGIATLYAQWTHDVTEYTVTFGAGTGFTSYGSVSAYNNTTSAPITLPATVRSGQSITFTATPETGYEVEGWYTNAACTEGKHDAGSTTYNTSITGVTNVYVKFVEKKWSVAFTAGTGGTVDPSKEQEVGQVTGATIIAEPAKGYSFAGWTSSNGGSFNDAKAETTTFYPTAETTVTANFTENLYTIIVESSDNNQGTVTPSTGEAGVATPIEVTAIPETGYRFVNWTATSGITIADPTSATTTITATKNGTLTAHFEEIPPHTIYLNPDSWTADSARFSVYYWNNTNPNGSWAEMVKVDANSQYYMVEIPNEYQDIMMVRLDPNKPENNWDNDWNQSGNLTIPTDGKNLYQLDNKTVSYLHLKPNNLWKSDNARFAAYFFGNGEKWVDLVKKGDYYTCEIPKNYPSVIFCRMNPANKNNNWDNENKWNQTGDLTIQKENNLYTLNDESWDTGTWSRLWDDSQWGTYIPEVTVTEETGDYRLVYVERLGQEYTKFHPAHSISKITDGTKKETVSFYINKDGQNPAILLQQCSIVGETITWNDVAIQYINGKQGSNPGGAMAPAKRVGELYIGNGCPAVTRSGVYNFVLQQTDGVATILSEETHLYTGDYYIRAYCTKGGWYDYLNQPENRMTYSQTALMHGGYDYYFCEWLYNGNNIKYTIANDYSCCISDTLNGDTIATTGSLPANANVRFTWNSSTNHLERGYIAGSGNAADRFLVLEGDENLKDANGANFNVDGLNPHQAIFKDMSDWQYQVDVKANDNTKVKLTATYNGATQHFKGNESETVALIEGAKEKAYKIRLIYDFKTNYLISALIDDEAIEDSLSVPEVMIIREHHEQAQTINVTTGSINNIQNVYAVMTLYRDTLNDTSIPERARALYWVSFPFDVNLEEAFGSGNYGEHWIMEYYDGEERAAKGGWVDATYWKYITDRTGYKLKAGVGYVLALDLSTLGDDSPVYGKTDHINIYFPSAANIKKISSVASQDIIVPSHTCTINRPTEDGDRRKKDSNWNIIGVPSYANGYSFDASPSPGFYYQWNVSDNNNDYYVPQVAGTFSTMHAYMVQFAGEIAWTKMSYTAPLQMAARKVPSTKDQYTLRLALQQEDAQCDHTFIRLQEEGATADFDMNVDLSKIMNSSTNIYSIIADKEEAAANVLPVEEVIIPIGVQTSKSGEYTFTMPDGTDGITAILIDYMEDTETNLLFADYTTTLSKGNHEGRFALHIRPNHVATAVETIIDGANGQIQKYIINGALYILNNGQLYDAQGRMAQP